MIQYQDIWQINFGRIPVEKDKGLVIEDDKVSYKIEKVENKHIVKIKACKTQEVLDEGE